MIHRSRALLAIGVTGLLALSAACGGDDSSTVADSDGGDEGGSQDASIAQDGTVFNKDAGNTTDANQGTDASGDASDGSMLGMGLDGGACDGGAVSITKVSPQFGSTTASNTVTITGVNFVQMPQIYVRNGGGTLTPLDHVAFVSDTSISGDVPSGLAAGTYDFIVVDPSGCAAVLAGGFKIVSNPIPLVVDVSPSTGTTQADVPVSVTGCDFNLAATLSTVASAGAVPVAQGVTSVVCNGPTNVCADATPLCTLTGTIKDKTLAMLPGAYVVRVTNPDTAFAEYSSFVITTPDGKLTGNWTAAKYSLNTGRRSLGLVSGRINNAKRYLYAVGGEDKNGVPLDSVEIAPLDAFGTVGKWSVGRNHLVQARSGLALTVVGEYLYALGGTDSTNGTGGAAPAGNPLASLERARILDPKQAPLLAQATVSAAAGTLKAGTYYYQVAAIMGAGDADNPSGETLASNEIVATLSATGQVTLNWSAVAGATSYVVYRSPTASSVSATEVLLVNPGNVLTYTDDGSAAADGSASAQTPLATGSLGVWQTRAASPLLTARLNASAAVATDPLGTQHLYVVGGYGTCPAKAKGVMTCYEHAVLGAGGASITGAFATGAQSLTKGRMRAGLSVINPSDGPGNIVTDAGADGGPNNEQFLIVGGGYGVNAIGNTIEYAMVNATGDVNPWGSTTGFAVERDGTQIMVANGYAYAFFGGTLPASYRNTSDLSTSIHVTSSSVVLGNWSNAGGAIVESVGRHGIALESAYFYVVGGTTNDTDAVNAVYQIIY
jgi:hypothetical protein